MRLFNKVAIIGTGLIGGSIALCIKKKRLARRVVGVAAHKESLLLAERMNAIDNGSLDINIIEGADLVILATPVSAILNSAPVISKIIGPDCIVSDVGSTKEEIAAKLNKIFPRYVGSHPLAGSEKRSVINACPGLFKDSLCILTPLKGTDSSALKIIKGLWEQLGAEVAFLNPAAHDKILAFVSHLPHAAAFSLINSIPDRYLKFSAAGLKDTTRIAASDNGLWTDIFLANPKNMLKAIGSLQENLKKIKTAIEKDDRKALNKILKGAKEKRNRL